ncbi:hypothetical protein [Spiroplasma endosymbiont of Crioceris asparagi]|uniref:hypothetical protein n=1 Tax=Spiroplasma endosymbiont of Crioceris asparagi TaxID=3066286 RepID=UPI0030CF7AEE
MFKKIYLSLLSILILVFSFSSLVSCGANEVENKMYKFVKIASYSAKAAIINSKTKLALDDHLDQKYIVKSMGEKNVKDELGKDFTTNQTSNTKMSSLFQMMFGDANYTYNNDQGTNEGIKTNDGGLTPKSDLQQTISKYFGIVYGFLQNGVKQESLGMLNKFLLDTLSSLSDLNKDPNEASKKDGVKKLSTFGKIDEFLQGIEKPIIEPMKDALKPISPENQKLTLFDYENKLADEIKLNPQHTQISSIIKNLISLNKEGLLGDGNEDKLADIAKLITSIIKYITFNLTVAYNYYDDYLKAKENDDVKIIGLLGYWNTKLVSDIPELKNNQINGEKLFQLLSGIFKSNPKDGAGIDNFTAVQALLYSPSLSEILVEVLNPILNKLLEKVNIGKLVVGFASDEFKNTDDAKKIEPAINTFIIKTVDKLPKIIIELLSPTDKGEELIQSILDEIIATKDPQKKDDIFSYLINLMAAMSNDTGKNILYNILDLLAKNASPSFKDTIKTIKGLLPVILGRLGRFVLDGARSKIRDILQNYVDKLADWNADINGIIRSLWSILYVGIQIDDKFSIGLKELFNAKLLNLLDDGVFAKNDILKNFYTFKNESLSSIFEILSNRFKTSTKLIKGKTYKVVPTLSLSALSLLLNLFTQKTCWFKNIRNTRDGDANQNPSFGGNLTKAQNDDVQSGKGINVTVLKGIEILNNNIMLNEARWQKEFDYPNAKYFFSEDGKGPNEGSGPKDGGWRNYNDYSIITHNNIFDTILGKDLYKTDATKDNDYLYKNSLIDTLGTVFGGKDVNDQNIVMELAQNQAFMCGGVLDIFQDLFDNYFKKSEKELNEKYFESYVDKKNWMIENNKSFSQQFKNGSSTESHFYFKMYWKTSNVFPNEQYKVWIAKNDNGTYRIEKITQQ